MAEQRHAASSKMRRTRTDVGGVKQRWFASCVCGWEGEEHRKSFLAVLDARQHDGRAK